MTKVAIITGASTGIGKETAFAFARDGYKVYLLARSKDKLDSISKDISANGGEAVPMVVDLISQSSIAAVIDSIASAEKQIDVLVNAAGIWHGADEVYAGIPFEQFKASVIADTYMVGFTAPSLLVNGLLPRMESGASIINISGTFADGGKGWVPYYASKRALEDLTIALSQDLQERGICVNCISPSDTATEEYKRYFPEYITDAQEPSAIADFAVGLCKTRDITGKVFVMKKDQEPFEKFHA